jgi:hypothetical protein
MRAGGKSRVGERLYRPILYSIVRGPAVGFPFYACRGLLFFSGSCRIFRQLASHDGSAPRGSENIDQKDAGTAKHQN